MEIDIMKRGLEYLKQLQTPSGLFLASPSAETGYNKVWLRDNVYISLAFIELEDFETVNQIYHGILNILLKHEEKIDWAIANKPTHAWQYIHARYNPETLEEFHDEWGNKQNDAVGAILWAVGTLEKSGHSVIRDDNDQRIIEKLVRYLEKIEYWHDRDNGMWEEQEEIHASSVGACLAGLIAIDSADIMTVPDELIDKGFYALDQLLPRESVSKFTDLSLLSLIYPYDLLNYESAGKIIHEIEYYLEKDMGFIRYKGDKYYNQDLHGGMEAEWTMGFPWLAIIYSKRDPEMQLGHARRRLLKTMSIAHNGHLPELYISNSTTPNKNNPLGWAESLLIVAAKVLNDNW